VVLLASSQEELERQTDLVERRQRLGFPLELWSRERLALLRPAIPAAVWGGLHSPDDGQIDPRAAMAALGGDAIRRGLCWQSQRVVAIEPRGAGERTRWRVRLEGGATAEAAWVVLAAGLGSGDLLRPLGLACPLEPVLGQAIELECGVECGDEPAGPAGIGPEGEWPGVLVWRGINLIPRPDQHGARRFWIGATLEPGERADPQAPRRLQDLDGAAPPWLRRARLIRSWRGLRPRPLGRPAPVLEELAPGLLLCSGHYRNGVLLAPASAAWVWQTIEGTAAPTTPTT
jgi:glycine/D-amino acid oxidase-like deaminating enzyme